MASTNQLRGTAGAMAIIAILLASQIPFDYVPVNPEFDNFGNNAIIPSNSTVFRGDTVQFTIHDRLLSTEIGVVVFLWDFHDDTPLINTTTDTKFIYHQFNQTGSFLVTILAIRAFNQSRAFSVPITVLVPENEILLDITTNGIPQNSEEILQVEEDQAIELQATDTGIYGSPEKIYNYLWEFGDGTNVFSSYQEPTIYHNYSTSGQYTIRVQGFTGDSVVYTSFIDVNVSNVAPQVEMTASETTISEDSVISFTSGIIDSASDIESMIYLWDFGNGQTRIGSQVSYQYIHDGIYTVTLTAIDDDGAVGIVTRDITIQNQAPVIDSLWTNQLTYFEGNTIQVHADIDEEMSDIPLLEYKWNFNGDGQITSRPFYDDGIYRLNLNVSDDQGAWDYAETDLLTVLNRAPYVSLVNATSSYDIEFSVWGTLATEFNISLFQELNLTESFTLTTTEETQDQGNPSHLITGLTQPLTEYWDLLYNVTANATSDFTAYVKSTFIFDGHDNVTLTTQCSGNKTCVGTDYRFPISPVDREFPVTYTFEIFDPGNDDVTVRLDLGDQIIQSTTLAPSEGPNYDLVQFEGILPSSDLASDITYRAFDDEGGQSPVFELPFENYLFKTPPAEFENQTYWFYQGHHLSHFRPESYLLGGGDVNIGDLLEFNLFSISSNTTVLEYNWNFGQGSQSTNQAPTFSYTQEGYYMVWVIIDDGDYQWVVYDFVNATSPFPDYEVFYSGSSNEDASIEFSVNIPLDDQDKILYYYWDFEDGTQGYGQNLTHVFNTFNNGEAFNVTLTIVDQYNFREELKVWVYINNTAPIISNQISDVIDIIEGETLSINPGILDSSNDYQSLEIEWEIDGEIYNDPLLSVWGLDRGNRTAVLTVVDQDNGVFTNAFVVNTLPQPIGINTLNTFYLYGSPNQNVTITGRLTPSVVSNTNIDDFFMSYELLRPDGDLLATGTGAIDTNNFLFEVNVDTTPIGNPARMTALESTLLGPDDITPENSESGPYVVNLILSQNLEEESRFSTNLVVSLDRDGDFITDELEIAYSNSYDFINLNYNSSDSDDNSNSDILQFVLGEDNDSDGVPALIEETLGTSDDDPDSDDDLLLDGEEIFTYLTDPLDSDSDNDGLTDLEELQGWSIEIITTSGIDVRLVTSSPLDADTDNDGIGDFVEMSQGIDPRKSDTDEDNVSDQDELDFGTSSTNGDTDFDGLSDFIEINRNYTLTYIDFNHVEQTVTFTTNPTMFDTDQDNLTDYEELFIYNSLPTQKDSDRDGIFDQGEVLDFHTNVIDADTDRDGLADGVEVSGFVLPIISIGPARYNETGHAITTPTYETYNITVYSNPLLADTDGDGLTDYEEVVGTAQNASDPSSIDTDGDGIADPDDASKLISDFAPPDITNDVKLVYKVKPGESLKRIVKAVSNTLEWLWNAVKGVFNLVSKLIDYAFKWGGACKCIPKIKSLSKIENKAKEYLIEYAEQVIKSSEGLGSKWSEVGNSFSNFDLGLKKKHGVPIDFTIKGTFKMVFSSVQSVVTSVVDPTVKIRFRVEDTKEISKIEVFRNGALQKTIRNIDSDSYWFSQTFTLLKNGEFSLKSSTFKFIIYDNDGNSRVITRQTDLITFAKESLEAVVETIIDPFVNVWNTISDGIQYLGNEIVEAANKVADVVEEVASLIANWILQQIESIWDGFVREVLGLFQRAAERSDQALDGLSQTYQDNRSTIANSITASMGSGLVTGLQTAADEVGDTISESLPDPDKGVFGALGDGVQFITGLFSSGVLGEAIGFLQDGAMKIVNNIVQEFTDAAISVILGNFQDTIVDFMKNLNLPDVSLDDLGALGAISSASTDILTMVLNYITIFGSLGDTLDAVTSQISGSVFLPILDGILIDDPNVDFSFFDLLKSISKPVGIIIWMVQDLVDWVANIFDFTLDEVQYVPSSFNLLETERLKVEFSTYQNLQTSNQPDQAVLFGTIAVKVLQFIAGAYERAIKEGVRQFEAFDRKTDADVDWGTQQVVSAIELFIGVILGILDIVEVGLANNFDYVGLNSASNDHRKVVMAALENGMGIIKFVSTLFLGPNSGSNTEQTFEKVWMGIEILISMTDIVYRGFSIDHDFDDNSDLENAINIMEIVLAVADPVLDVVSYLINDGLEVGGSNPKPALTGTPLAVYIGYKVFVVLLDLAILVLDTIAAFV